MGSPKRFSILFICTALVVAFLGIVLAQGPPVNPGRPVNPGPPASGFLAGKTLDFSAARSLPYLSSDQVMFENVIVNGLHYLILMRWQNAKIEPVGLYPIETVQIPFGISDWSGVEPLLIDPLGDAEPGGPSGTDFTALYMTRGGGYVYFRLDLDAPPPVGFTYSVGFSQYLNQANTPGDLTAETSCVAVDSRSTMVWGNNGPADQKIYDGWDSIVLGNSIRWRVPTSKLRYMDGVPSPSSGPQGIENRFLSVTVWGEKSSTAPGFRDGINDPLKRPMIVKFW